MSKNYLNNIDKSNERVTKHMDGTEPFKTKSEEMAWIYLN